MRTAFCRASVAVVIMLSAVALGGGCAHETAEARQLASLEEGIHKDTADRDRLDPRLDPSVIALEQQSKAAPPKEPVVAPPRVVALGGAGGGDDGAVDDPNDSTPRPVIRVVGNGIVRRTGHGRDDRIEETIPDEPADGARVGPAVQEGAPPPSALDPGAKRAYDSALALVNGHDYDRALDAFAAFLVRWPDHPNANNAMYWRGEAYFAKGEIARAAEEFEGVLKRFPLGAKVPDCLLKLGICAQKLGNRAKAQSYFERLTREYPRSEAARRIPTDRSAGRAGPEESP